MSLKSNIRRAGALPAVCILALGLALVPSAAQAQDAGLCAGYEGKQKVTKLAGPNAFSKKKLTSMDDLRSTFESMRAGVEHVLQSNGLGSLMPEIYAAVESGEGVSEMQLAPGDTMEWMAFRKAGKPWTIANVCMGTKKTYDAYRIEVSEDRDTTDGGIERTTYVFAVPKVCSNISFLGSSVEEIAPPEPMKVCKLEVDRSFDENRTLKVDAGGSSEGVVVTMDGPQGTQTLVSGGDTAWEGADPDPYADLSFTASVEGTGRNGRDLSCSITVDSESPVEVPTCELSVDPAEVKRGDDVTVRATGSFTKMEITVDGPGNLGPLTGATNTIALPKAGTYVFSGTATNQVGDTAECSAEAKAKGGWTVRGFYANGSTDGDNFTDSTAAVGSIFREELMSSSGDGFGLNVEKHLSDKFGLELGYLTMDFDTRYMVDTPFVWEMDEDDLGFDLINFGANFHLTPNSFVDLYLGPFIGYASIDDVEYQVLGGTTRRSYDDEFVFGAQVGLDIPFGADNPWSLHTGVVYIDSDADSDDDAFDLGLDPLVGTIGIAYSF